MKLAYSAVAKCRPEDIWTVFTDSTRWSEWSSLLAGAHWIEGEAWQPGSQCLLELAQPAFKLKTKVKECAPPNKVVWTGAVMGVNIENAFEFNAQPDGTTLMKADIDLSGPGTFFINDDMKNKGMAAFTPWFESLRAQGEKLSAK